MKAENVHKKLVDDAVNDMLGSIGRDISLNVRLGDILTCYKTAKLMISPRVNTSVMCAMQQCIAVIDNKGEPLVCDQLKTWCNFISRCTSQSLPYPNDVKATRPSRRQANRPVPFCGARYLSLYRPALLSNNPFNLAE